MVISLQDLVSKVRIKLNEDPRDELLVAGMGPRGVTLDRLIASVADEVITETVEQSIFTGFDDLQKLFGEIKVSDGVGRLELQADFSSLVELRLSCWDRAITTVSSPGEPDYWRRLSLSPVSRGTAANPRAYIVEDESSRYLELHPAEPGAKILYGLYVAIPVMTPVGTFYLPERILPCVTTAIADRVRKILSDNNL